MPPLGAGSALLLRDSRMGTHLWFLLTDPDPARASTVLVMLVTEKSHTVDYGTATFAPVSRLEEALTARRALLADGMSDELLTRVRSGLLTSGRTPNEAAEYCRLQFLR